MPFLAQIAIGFGVFLVWTVVTFSIFTVAGLVGPSADLVARLAIGLTFASLGVLTVIAWKRWHWRGFLTGLLIAAGLTLLAYGVCVGVGLFSH